MSKVVSMRLEDGQMVRLERAARQLGRTAAETAALLLEESLREREHPLVEFRDDAVGRQAYVKGTRLSVWMLVWLTRAFDSIPERTAEYLEIPVAQVSAAMDYAADYPAEIDAAIAKNDRTPEELRPLLPSLRVYAIDPTSL